MALDAAALRAEFPVLAHTAYLNSGTTGPVPRASASAAAAALEQGVEHGRGAPYYMAMLGARDELRADYARLLGAAPEDVAITTSTSEGIVRVLAALDLAAGDEVLTSDEEHPGLLGPLAAARRLRGISVRAVPFARVAGEVGPQTRLVACSHVSWASGQLIGDLSGAGVPVLLDGAQGIGAVPVDVAALGCDFYAGSGQKWLCGPVGSGMLWISPQYSERLPASGPTYVNLVDPGAGLDAVARADAARHDAGSQSLETVAGARAAFGVLDAAGWDTVHERAAALAAELAGELAQRGRDVVQRDRTTLVSWHEQDPAATRDAAAAAGVLIRDLPGRGLLRASVGAWNDRSDLERLLAALP